MRNPSAPLASLALAAAVVAACGHHVDSPTVPGQAETGTTKALDAGAEAMQDKSPIAAIHAHVVGFGLIDGDVRRAVETHNYCAHLNEEFQQCVIYDGDGPDARLIGVEYLISARLFDGLPAEERRLWHSHVYEVKAGLTYTPGVPDVSERALMRRFVTMYGKIWYTWQVDHGDQLPLGLPQLMTSYTADGQLDPARVAARDQRYRVSTDDKRRQREDIPAPAVAPGADAWTRGEAVHLRAQVGDGAPGR